MSRPDLLAPYTFRNGAVAKNRVALAPMTNSQSNPDGSLHDDELNWLLRRAQGGFGILETCAAHVALDGKSWEGELGVFDDALLPGLERLASALRHAETLGLVQIFHGGARAERALIGGPPVSASAIPGDPNEPREATSAEVEAFIEKFKDAAVRSHRAGFAGVELHGAHGYLFGQFLSKTQNQRADRWGGAPFENRARLLREATRAVRSAVPASFLVGVRLSPEDWGNAKGLDLDETLQLAGWLADDGVDFLHLSLWDSANNSTKRPDAHPLTLFRAKVPEDLTLFVAGKIYTRAEADALLDKGADVVALGRSAILDPDWPRHAADPTWEPKRPPVTIAELEAQSLSPAFARLMRRWKGFVAD